MYVKTDDASAELRTDCMPSEFYEWLFFDYWLFSMGEPDYMRNIIKYSYRPLLKIKGIVIYKIKNDESWSKGVIIRGDHPILRSGNKNFL